MAQICCFCLSKKGKGRQKTRPPPYLYSVSLVAVLRCAQLSLRQLGLPSYQLPGVQIIWSPIGFLVVLSFPVAAAFLHTRVWKRLSWKSFHQNSPEQGRSQKLKMHLGPDFRNSSELCVLLFVLGLSQQYASKTRFGKAGFGRSGSVPLQKNVQFQEVA